MSHNLKEVTTADFQAQVLQSVLPVLVDFGADWCPPCKMLNPIIDQIAAAHAEHLRVVAVDVDDHPQLQEQYGVMGLPTLILFQNGAPVARMVGFQPRERIESQIQPYLR